MLGAIVRFVVSALVLMLLSFLMGRQFHVGGFGPALFASIVIAALGWIVERLMGRNVSPQARGVTGFITAAVIIYVAQWFVAGFSTTILGALLAAFLIGLADTFVPTELR
jgi:putative membrane protein